jgi:hypothetical protein
VIHDGLCHGPETSGKGVSESIMVKKKGGSSRVERDAGTGRYVPKGTERKHPDQTVTEPRKPKRK